MNRDVSKDIFVRVVPVGMIFNMKPLETIEDYDNLVGFTRDYRYSAEADHDYPNKDNYIFAGYKRLLKSINGNQNDPLRGFFLSWDVSSHDACDSIFGIGKYRIEFWDVDPDSDELTGLIDYINMDYGDWDLPNYQHNDVWIRFNSNNNITFQFIGGNVINIDHTDVNRNLRIFSQVGTVDPLTYSFSKTPNKGYFKTTNERNNSYLYFPIKATDYNGFNQHLNYGSLFLNFSISSGHHAYIKQNETMYIEYGATFTISDNAILTFQPNSTLFIKHGGKFCNNGTVNGNINIIYERRGVVSYCSPAHSPFIGGNVTIEDSAIVEFPDSTTIVFDSSAVFTMNPYSELRLGKNTRLVFQNGSRIKCDNVKITSLDSTQTWDGIYLDGIAYDTLKNCTFQNAVNGINITDNYNPFGSPGAVEISNCTFKNSTSSDLLNYVYVNNSYNVLIKGCNSEKTGSGGFTAGIIAEYCPTNGVAIADNNLNYVTTGISLLQSSEYIGRNTITGSTNSGTGIYLDNSNGTIEYNTVNNFQKSVYGSYSSPYMLKNTLSNAYVKNIDLASNSYPVMKPVVSGSTLRWLGGDNTITGTPSNSGIAFADCYPLMDSGYNRITVNGSDYMNGNFTFVYTTVNAKINYWYDNPPQSSLFDISGGNVNYSDAFDGSTLPSTDGTELNSIGWGMYDTVFTKSFGDNSTPEDLFMQAYTEEMSQNYTDAITHYKEVVSSYKTSSFAPVSLSRIFNSLEKSHASSSDYQIIQSYYNSIKSNSAYPVESRELAEDFVIKSKVKQGNVEDAVNDYNAIYQSNQNNSKGLHALLNKYCLENMVQGDNLSGNTNYQNHKINVLSLITGENIKTSSFTNNNTPKQFRLLQNYPNPFNPVTNIKYEIPKDVNVSIKIYDILGREVFSFNEYKLAGSYEVQFDGSNFASGMYFYKMVVGELRNKSGNTNNGEIFTDTKKMVLLK
ncbi:MAG TPA: T9SS type A sorting domain-containing protein [Ignavibacteria bacterium]|nr:T9SS type A sorting domain-containing protein [Ignavibacteria bacterium]HMQ99513.1 T9SS type A sorting domain-containing protein [Ignavibacteria bacterium]